VNPDNRSVEMRFEILDPSPAIRVGSFATVLVNTTSTVQGVELPEAAVVRIGEGDAVFVSLGGGRFEPRMVSALPLGDGRLAVEGLDAGTEVVIEGAYFLKSALEGEDEEEGEG
jgi:multidrug efflux pump subunit AcrA (membrane-fusion protein)